LIFFPLGWQLAVGGAFLKILNQLIVLSAVNKRLKEPISIGFFPILDFVHCMFIFAFSFPARFSRRATWM
jgi:hypothetical protein